MRQFVIQPVRAVFARPGLGSIAGTTQQHEVLRIPLGVSFISRHFVWHSMIDLQIPRLKFTGTDSAFASAALVQLVLEFLRKRSSTLKLPFADLSQVTELVSRYRTPIRGSNPKSLQWYSRFADITRRSRRMVVAYFFSNSSVVMNPCARMC